MDKKKIYTRVDLITKLRQIKIINVKNIDNYFYSLFSF